MLGTGLAVLLTLAGAVRIVNSYEANSVTTDERDHIGAGVQWLREGRYTYEPQHPPLARVFVALGPHLAGLDRFELRGRTQDGHSALFGRGDPERNLVLARVGTLPFYLLASVVVLLWALNLGGWTAGAGALLLFTSAPPVLAHAGLATTDMAASATLVASLFAFYRCLERPDVSKSALLGGFSALALLAKLSALVFLPVCFAAIAGVMAVSRIRERNRLWVPRWRHGGLVVVAIAAGTVVLWAGYRFSINPIEPEGPHEEIDAIFETGSRLNDLASSMVEIPVPAPEFVKGIKQLAEHAGDGHPAYLLGQTSRYGWWYFFPVALLFKTPVAFLLLIAVGVASATWAPAGRRRTGFLAVIACAGALLASVLPSTLNIGVRHILPIYGLAAIIGGLGTAALWQADARQPLKRLLAVGLLGWNATASLAAHPQYIPYFNGLAHMIHNPILVDSDRDWGQATHLLTEYAARNRIASLQVAILGVFRADLARYGFVALDPNDQTTGWLAVSYHHLCVLDGYQWLLRYEPVAILGESILVFHLPPTDSDRPAHGDDGRDDLRGESWRC